MKFTYKSNIKKRLFFGVSLFLFLGAFAQVKYTNKNNVALTVSGTSTLHDWDMKTNQGSCDATFSFNAANGISGITGLSFVTPATALKSGHEAMDKNAYKALKTDKAASISYTASAATVTAVDATDYLVKSTGKLTIAGATLDAEVIATCKINADKSITVMGSKKISMKDFSMSPPSFMMGTIKTGDDVTIKFDLKMSK